MTEPIRIVEGSWTHTCLRVPGHEGEPIKLHLPGVGGCPHCGDPGPDRQKEIDIVSTETLRASGVGVTAVLYPCPFCGESGVHDEDCPTRAPAVEFVVPRPDMGEPGGHQEVEVVDENEIPF